MARLVLLGPLQCSGRDRSPGPVRVEGVSVGSMSMGPEGSTETGE